MSLQAIVSSADNEQKIKSAIFTATTLLCDDKISILSQSRDHQGPSRSSTPKDGWLTERSGHASCLLNNCVSIKGGGPMVHTFSTRSTLIYQPRDFCLNYSTTLDGPPFIHSLVHSRMSIVIKLSLAVVCRWLIADLRAYRIRTFHAKAVLFGMDHFGGISNSISDNTSVIRASIFEHLSQSVSQTSCRGCGPFLYAVVSGTGTWSWLLIYYYWKLITCHG